MPQVELAFRRARPLFVGLAGLYLTCLAVVRAGVLSHRPEVLALAVTTDLTLTATLAVWWFGLRRGLLPRRALAATAVTGLGAAMVMLPAVRGVAVLVLGYSWAALEIVALGALALRVRSLAHETRNARAAGRGFPEALEGAITGAMRRYPVVARVLANELCVVGYAACAWFRRPQQPCAGERVFEHAGLSQWRALLWAIALLIAAEGMATHVLVSLWSPLAAWTITGAELYALLWLVGDYQLLRMNPVRVTPLALHIELGLRGRATIPFAAVRALRAFDGRDEQDYVVIPCVFGKLDLVLELHAEVAVTRGLRRIATRRIVLRAGAWQAAMAERVRGAVV